MNAFLNIFQPEQFWLIAPFSERGKILQLVNVNLLFIWQSGTSFRALA